MSADRLAARLETKLERAEARHEYKCARREAKAERKELRREAKAERKELRHEYRCARREARHGHYHSHHCGGSGPRFGHANSFGHHAGFGRGGPGYGSASGAFGHGYYGHGYAGQPRRPGDGHTFIVGAVSKVIGWGKLAVQQAAQSRKQQGQQHQTTDYPQDQEYYHQYAGARDIERGVASSGGAPAKKRGGGDEKRHHSDEDGEWEDVENDSGEEAGRAPDEPLPPYEAVVRTS